MRLSPCSVVWMVPPGRFSRSSTRTAVPTFSSERGAMSCPSSSVATMATMSSGSGCAASASTLGAKPICSAVAPDGYTTVLRMGRTGMRSPIFSAAFLISERGIQVLSV